MHLPIRESILNNIKYDTCVLGDRMSRLIKIRLEDVSGNELDLKEVEVVKGGGIKGSYKKGKELLDCTVYFDEPLNPKGLCSKRYKYNILLDEKLDLKLGQIFKIGQINFEVVRKKECFKECILVQDSSYCPLRSAVFIRAIQDGVIKIGDEIKL